MVCCKYGEALLCAGRRAAGWRKFEEAVSLEEWRGESAAWKGEMLLLTGAYANAVQQLAGARASFSRGWLGAAYFKTGRLKEAEALLEAEVEKNDPLDHEVRLWLAELSRVTGKFERALRLLDGVLKKKPGYELARVNRALLFAATGRRRDMRRELDRIDKELIDAAAAGPGRKAQRGTPAGDEVRILERILELAAGNRRHEKYFLNLNFPGMIKRAASAGGRRLYG